MFGSSLGQLGRRLGAGDLELGEVGAVGAGRADRAARAGSHPAAGLERGAPPTKVVRAMQQGST
jgi:hypothetical protein